MIGDQKEGYMQYLKKLKKTLREDFNEELYWKRRMYVQSQTRAGLLLRIRLFLLHRTESKKICTTGIGLPGDCCQIASPLILSHGLNGITFGSNVVIGRNVQVYQHVTIAEADKTKKTVIEDDVVIGAGAVILNNSHIGRGAKIGANAVVTKDVPAGATAVGVPARILPKHDETADKILQTTT